MNCSEVQASLVDLLYEELGVEERSRLLPHLEACAECRERWSRLQALSAAADSWTPPPIPRGIAERALVRVASEQVRVSRRQGLHLPAHRLVATVLLGAAAAVFSLLLVAGTVAKESPPLILGLTAAVWSALYGGVLLLAQQDRYWRLGLTALAGAGLSLLLAPVLSIPAVIEACWQWLQAAQGSASLNLLLFVAGVAYAAGPVLASGVMVKQSGDGGVLERGLRLSGLYGLLVAPSIFLQCLPLALSVTAPWMAGALVGIFAGSLGATRVRGPFAPSYS
jgi:anti-sigma factor RsiW